MSARYDILSPLSTFFLTGHIGCVLPLQTFMGGQYGKERTNNILPHLAKKFSYSRQQTGFEKFI
jgi:hypothetical protein